jgi:hypothetical protein
MTKMFTFRKKGHSSFLLIINNLETGSLQESLVSTVMSRQPKGNL